MTELTKHHERVIEAAVECVKNTESEEWVELSEAIAALQASQQPKIDPAIKDLPVGAEILVSDDGVNWDDGIFLNCTTGLEVVSAYRRSHNRASGFKYAKLSPTAETHLIWHENTGDMPCDGEQMILGDYGFNIIEDRAEKFIWGIGSGRNIKRYCMLE